MVRGPRRRPCVPDAPDAAAMSAEPLTPPPADDGIDVASPPPPPAGATSVHVSRTGSVHIDLNSAEELPPSVPPPAGLQGILSKLSDETKQAVLEGTSAGDLATRRMELRRRSHCHGTHRLVLEWLAFHPPCAADNDAECCCSGVGGVAATADADDERSGPARPRCAALHVVRCRDQWRSGAMATQVALW